MFSPCHVFYILVISLAMANCCGRKDPPQLSNVEVTHVPVVSVLNLAEHDRITGKSVDADIGQYYLAPNLSDQEHHPLNAKSMCKGVPPGIKHLVNGVNVYFTPLHRNETDPVTARIFDMTCMNLKKEEFGKNRTYNIPDQVDYAYPNAKSMYHSVQRSFQSFEELKSQIGLHLWGFWTGFIRNVGLGNYFNAPSNHTSSETTGNFVTTITSFVREEYKVRLAMPAVHHSITAEFKLACKSLPVANLIPVEYFQFIKAYGTHIQMSAVIGGRYNKVRKHYFSSVRSDEPRIDGFNEGIPKSIIKDTNSDDLYMYTEGGDMDTNATAAEWARTVEERPVVISAQFVALIRLCPNVSEDQVGLFNRALLIGNAEQKLRALQVFLLNVLGNSGLVMQLQRMISKELHTGSARMALPIAISTALLGNEGMEGISVIQSCPQVGSNAPQMTKILMLNGMCMTSKTTLIACIDVTWSFSDDRICLSIYGTVNCDGKAIKEITQPSEIGSLIRVGVSFRLCDGFAM